RALLTRDLQRHERSNVAEDHDPDRDGWGRWLLRRAWQCCGGAAVFLRDYPTIQVRGRLLKSAGSGPWAVAPIHIPTFLIHTSAPSSDPLHGPTREQINSQQRDQDEDYWIGGAHVISLNLGNDARHSYSASRFPVHITEFLLTCR